MYTTLDTIMAENKYMNDIKKYEKLSKEADNLATHIDLNHIDIYANSLKKKLKVKKDNVEDINQTDLELLKDPKYQKAVADEMADRYKESSKDFFDKVKKKYEESGEEWKLDEFEEALLTDAVHGVTRSELKQIIATEKDQFTPEKFMSKYRPQFMKKIRVKLKSAAGQYLTEEHLEHILNYTLEDDLIGKVKDYLNINHGKMLLENYKGQKLGKADILEIHKEHESEGISLLPSGVAKDLEEDVKKKKKESLEKLTEEEEPHKEDKAA